MINDLNYLRTWKASACWINVFDLRSPIRCVHAGAIVARGHAHADAAVVVDPIAPSIAWKLTICPVGSSEYSTLCL